MVPCMLVVFLAVFGTCAAEDLGMGASSRAARLAVNQALSDPDAQPEDPGPPPKADDVNGLSPDAMTEEASADEVKPDKGPAESLVQKAVHHVEQKMEKIMQADLRQIEKRVMSKVEAAQAEQNKHIHEMQDTEAVRSRAHAGPDISASEDDGDVPRGGELDDAGESEGASSDATSTAAEAEAADDEKAERAGEDTDSELDPSGAAVEDIVQGARTSSAADSVPSSFGEIDDEVSSGDDDDIRPVARSHVTMKRRKTKKKRKHPHRSARVSSSVEVDPLAGLLRREQDDDRRR